MTAPIFVELPLAARTARTRPGSTIIVNACLVTTITGGESEGECVVTVAQLGGGIVHALVAGPPRAVALALSMGKPEQPTAWTAEQLAEVGL